MRITSGNKTIDYSVTPEGNYMETVRSPFGVIVRSTPYVDTFLKRMLEPVVTECTREERLDEMCLWWIMPNRYRALGFGSFNREHYYKVMERKLGLTKPVKKVSVINQFKNRVKCLIQAIL